MNIYEKLTAIQNKLKAPKDAENTFGKYKYRTIDSINEALKPLLDEYHVSVTVSDEVEFIGDRFYIKATATLTDDQIESNVEQIRTITACAYAREPDTKKGSDESQITGAASTYARKYALTGLFLLDNSEDDPDKTAGSNQTATTPKKSVPKKTEPAKCAACGAEVTDQNLIMATTEKYKKVICMTCIEKKKAEIAKKKAEEEKKAAEADLPFPLEKSELAQYR